MTKNSIM